MSSNPAHGDVDSIQHNVIKFVSDLRQIGDFPRDSPVSSTNKTDRNDITEILLKVALNTITQIRICLSSEICVSPPVICTFSSVCSHRHYLI